MKIKLILGMVLICFSMSLNAQNLTQTSVNKTNAVLEKVIEAYGGAERINQLNSISITFNDKNAAVNQSRNPGPPWDMNATKGHTHIDLENQIFVSNFKSDSPNQDFDNATIINGDKSFQVNNLAQTATPIAEPNFLNTAGPFIRVTPISLVQQLMTRSQFSHYLGEADIDGKPHHVITLVMEVGPGISLYFDQKSHLLTSSERFIPAFGLIGYQFLDYKNVDGIPYNHKFILTVDGEVNLERKVLSIKPNESIKSLAVLDEKFSMQEPLAPDPLSRQKLADGVYLIGGSRTYAMFIEMEDYVIAVGGTAGIPDRINLLKEVIPNKPIKYGVMTHHHGDHILGAQAYADEGATIITAKQHKETIKNSITADKIMIDTVSKKKTFKDKKRRVEIIDIGPTAHTTHFLLAYVPDAGIIFEADHFGLQTPGNIVPASQAAQDFAEALKKYDIKADKIASSHSPVVATRLDLTKSIEMVQN